MKTKTAWAIYSGEIMLYSAIRSTRKETIDKHCHLLNSYIPVGHKYKNWRQLKRQGYTCRKIEIKEVG